MDKAHDAFRTISEVANELGVPKHVLRFWESKFPQIKPMKRGGGRRYYRPEDMQLLGGIRRLLHADGYTIKGVQKILREQGIDKVKQAGESLHDHSLQSPRRASVSSKPKGRRTKQKVKTRKADKDKPVSEVVNAPPSNSRARVAQIDSLIQELHACRSLLVGKSTQSVCKSPTGRKSRTVRSA